MKTISKNQNQKPGLLNRPEQSSTENTQKSDRPKIDMALRRANRKLETEKLLALLRSQTPNFFELAEVVGKWVWIQFLQTIAAILILASLFQKPVDSASLQFVELPDTLAKHFLSHFLDIGSRDFMFVGDLEDEFALFIGAALQNYKRNRGRYRFAAIKKLLGKI